MVTVITGLIGQFLYPLLSVIFGVINLLQGVFTALAGIGDIDYNGKPIHSGNSGAEDDTGLIYYLLTSDSIKNLFMSILVLALILIIIFTAMAFIKNAYSSRPKNWQEIVGNAFKGLANFIFVPVCCLLGVWLGNILLNAINGATSTDGSTQMSRKLFICCAYNANLYRTGDKKVKNEEDAKKLETWATGELGDKITVEFKGSKDEDQEYYATIVDRVYAESTIDIHWWGNVDEYYSLFNFNYVILIVGGVFMLYVLVSLAYAMIKRMFILLMLFVISPALCAMYPLDEGAVVGNWKNEFKKYTISAYGAIAAMNLFFSILHIVQNIQLISGTGPFLNDIFQLLIMVSGLYVVKEFMSTLSGWIGGDDAMKSGEGLRSSTKKVIADNYKKVTGGIGNTVGAFANTIGHQKSEGFFKGLWSGTKDTFVGKKNEKGEREGGLFNYMSGGTIDHARKDLWRGVVKKEFKAGKESGETDKRRDVAKEMKSKFKENGWEDAKFVKDEKGSITDKDGKTIHRNSSEERAYQYFQYAKSVGYSDDEAYQMLESNINNDLKRVNKAPKTRREIIERVKTGEKMTVAREKEEAAATSRAESSAANTQLAQAIKDALRETLSTPDGAGGTTPSGAESRVEAAAQERMENILTNRAHELLEELKKITKGGGSTGRGQIVDQFGNAISSIQNTETQVQQAMSKFVEDMKKSAEVEKSLYGLDKEIGKTEEELEDLAKKIRDIAKGDKK